jgi:hypothetical protein
MENSDPQPGEQGVFLGRPLFQLRSLPIPMRWEVTRRHSYYQIFWKSAAAHYQGRPASSEVEEFLRQAAVTCLAAIGVTAEPPDPAREYGELESAGLEAAWLSGAVHPISLRGMAALLIASLQKRH